MDNLYKKDRSSLLVHWHNLKIRLVGESIIIGIMTGFIIVLFRIVIEKLGEKVGRIYEIFSLKPYFIPLWVILFIVLGYMLGYMVKKDPMTAGSGIPQVKGVILRKLEMKWFKVILNKFIGGSFAIGFGLSLGREGPSVQLGACVGQGLSRILKRVSIEEKYLITSGASAGLAAAFNAPLAGAIFAMEEIHKNFSPLILISAFSAALSADFITGGFLGLSPVFNFKHIGVIPLNYYFYIILFGIIMGVTGVAFNISLLKSQQLYSKQKWIPKEFNPVFPLLTSIIFGLFLPEVLGGGNSVIAALSSTSFTIKFILVLILMKFLFTMLCYGSGTPGGIFLPVLTIGALIGYGYGSVLINMLNIDTNYINNFVILGMAAYFTAVVRSPITGTILITEMTGGFNNFLPLSIVSIVAYLVADALGSKPIYDSLLERFLIGNTDLKVENTKSKFILEVPVCMGCTLDGKEIKNIKWPQFCLITEIRRGAEIIIPKGNTVICAGDYITILTNEKDAGKLNDILNEMCQNIEKT